MSNFDVFPLLVSSFQTFEGINEQKYDYQFLSPISKIEINPQGCAIWVLR